jgi:hypothetical protein
MKRWVQSCLAMAMVFLATGCKALFSTERTLVKSPWESFAAAQAAFDQIVPGQTTTNDLKALGFDPFATPNVKIINYLDLIARFMPNASVTPRDLHEEVRKSLEARERSCGYEVEIKSTRRKRFGNLALDILGFHRKTRETGWTFKALLVIRDGRVVYKLSAGEPGAERLESKTKPLGPFQELDNAINLIPK